MASNDVTVPAKYQCTLTAELLTKAEQELNEKEKWRDRDIQALRDMVLLHKGLNSRTDDAFLLRFLRARKFDYDRAYNLLLNYYTIRASHPELFGNITPSSLDRLYDSGVVSLLPHRDKEGRRIMYVRAGKWNPNEYQLSELLVTALVNLELAIEDEQTQVCGVVVIENVADLGLIHARNMDQKAAKLLTSIIQDAFPMRIKGLHFVNEPAIFSAIFAIVKPFLKEKTVKRLNFHGSSLESLQKYFDIKVLPEELGGTLASGSQLAKDWKAEVLQRTEILGDFEKYKIELPHEISKTRASDATECLTGTYKKLNVD